MGLNLSCSTCGLPYPPNGLPHRCPSCGGLFDYAELLPFDPALVLPSQPGIWRYRKFFDLPENAPRIYLGEGHSPLVWDQVDGIRVGYKLDSLNPTGSYKDRGSAVLASQLVSRGITHAVEDSSGNAGASFAAYATRAGIHAKVFVPASASGPKLNQIGLFGAELVKVDGPRSAAADAVLQEVESGAAYASHAFLPFGLPGIATLAYEIWESMGAVPGSVVIPAGHGALLLGALRGFRALKAGGLVNHVPYMVGVQAQNCAPLAAAFADGVDAIERVVEGATIAEGVRVRRPARADALLREMPAESGSVLAIPEEEILPAFKELARHGIYVEPTAALSWAAFKRLKGQLPEPVVLVISGSGLKYQQS